MTSVEMAPIVKAVEVRRTPAEAFRVFTQEMSAWWPMATHSRAKDAAGEKTVRIEFEPKVGGRIYETLNSGEERDWGEVLVFEPGRRLLFTLQMGRARSAAGEVEVRFEPVGVSSCRVTLTHAHWERYGDEAELMRGRFAGGWVTVFDKRFADYVGRVETEGE